jgi:hypothetical protein
MLNKLSAILLIVFGGVGVSQPSSIEPLRQPTIDQIQWPLGRGGNERIRLDIPSTYGAENSVAQKFYAAIQKKHRQFSNRAYETLLIRAMWPNLEPAGTDVGFDRPPGVMTAILSSGAVETFEGEHFDALQTELRSAVMLSRDLCFNEGPPRQCYRRDDADVKPSRFGLQHLGVDFSKYPELPEEYRSRMQGDDIYFQRDPSGQLVTVILCTAEEAKTAEDGPQYQAVARCDQKFVLKSANAVVSLTYSRRLLKDWSSIQARWQELLNSFVSAAALAGENK